MNTETQFWNRADRRKATGRKREKNTPEYHLWCARQKNDRTRSKNRQRKLREPEGCDDGDIDIIQDEPETHHGHEGDGSDEPQPDYSWQTQFNEFEQNIDNYIQEYEALLHQNEEEPAYMRSNTNIVRNTEFRETTDDQRSKSATRFSMEVTETHIHNYIYQTQDSYQEPLYIDILTTIRREILLRDREDDSEEQVLRTQEIKHEHIHENNMPFIENPYECMILMKTILLGKQIDDCSTGMKNYSETSRAYKRYKKRFFINQEKLHNINKLKQELEQKNYWKYFDYSMESCEYDLDLDYSMESCEYDFDYF